MSLQRLYKWKTSSPNLRLSQPVLIIEESPMTNTWTLGLIVELHPGVDNYVHVVTVCTKDGVFKQSITKVAPLPIIEDI